VTAPVEREQSRLRPLPWRRMVWVTWRQHRFAFAGVSLLLGGLAAYLWIIGRQLHHAYAAAITCHPTSSVACVDAISNFNGLDRFFLGGYVLQPLPALIGAFVGAPLLARELETGTFRYAWTQGFGRWRWTLAKLVLLALAVVAAAAAISVLFSWYYKPYFGAGNSALSLRAWSPLDAYLFDLRGAAFAAWALVAFAIGALAGALIRQVVPAIAATLAAYAGLAIAVGMFLRQHYQTPLATSRLNLPSSAWVVGQWWTKGGKVVFSSWPPQSLAFHICPPSVVGERKSNASFDALMQCFARHGYTFWHHYQPANRFWTFQAIESSWLLALSALLIAATVWLVQRRAA
jgi:ABC-2 family transporter protein